MPDTNGKQITPKPFRPQLLRQPFLSSRQAFANPFYGVHNTMLAISRREPHTTTDTTLVRRGKLASDVIAIIIVLAELTSADATVCSKHKAPLPMDALPTSRGGALESAWMQMTFSTTLRDQLHAMASSCQDVFAGLDFC
jgi:hypothetical protein